MISQRESAVLVEAAIEVEDVLVRLFLDYGYLLPSETKAELESALSKLSEALEPAQ